MSARGNENLPAKHTLIKVSSMFCVRASFGAKFTATEGRKTLFAHNRLSMAMCSLFPEPVKIFSEV